MAWFVRASKHSLSSLTHHGLIKLIILQTLAQHNQNWEQFTAQVQELAPLPSVPIEEEMDVPILMGLVENQEDSVNPQLGGNVEKQEVRKPSNLVGGG